MNDIKKGDIVVRKSYGKDIIFRVINILNKPEEKIAVLNGVIERIEADSKIADLELVDKQKVKDILYLSQILEILRNKINFIKFALNIEYFR